MGRNKNLAKESAFGKREKELIRSVIGNIDRESLEKDATSVVGGLLVLFEESSDGHTQLLALKKLSNAINLSGNVVSSENTDKLINLLCLLFIHCNPRHPVRKTVASMLQQFSNSLQVQTREIFVNYFINTMSQLSEMVSTSKKGIDITADIRWGIELITATISDFETGHSIILRCFSKVLQVLTMCACKLISLARNVSGLEEQSIIMMDCLFCFKASVAVLSSGKRNIPSVDSVKDTDSVIVPPLCSLLSCSLDVTWDEEFLLDCRIAASMLIPLILQDTLPFNQCRNLYLYFLKGRPFRIHSDDTQCSCIIDMVFRYFDTESLSILTKLCILHALLVKCNKDILHSHIEGLQSNDVSLFNTDIITGITDICKLVTEKSALVTAFRTLSLWTSEALYFCKDTALCKLKLFELGGPILTPVLDVLVTYLGHPIDAVRHQIKAALDNIFKLIKLFPNSDTVFRTLFYNFVGHGLNHRENFSVLICLIDLLDMQNASAFETFPETILGHLGNVDVSTYASQLYIKAALRSYKASSDTSTEEQWLIHWIEPLFKLMSGDCENQKFLISDQLLPQLLGANRELDISRWFHKYCCDRYLYSIPILIRIIKERRHVTHCSTSWHDLVSTEIIEVCLEHHGQQVRMDTFSLLCESHKTTEPVDESDLELIRLFLEHNMNNQSPHYRKHLTMNFTKVLRRIKENARKMGGANQNYPTPDTISVIGRYKKFLVSVISNIFYSLQYGASFARMNTALLLLESILEFFIMSTQSTDFKQIVIDETLIYSEEHLTALIACLYCDYDANKVIATKILERVPSPYWVKWSNLLNLVSVDCLRLLSGAQPDDAVTGSFLLVVLASSGLIQDQQTILRAGDDVLSPEQLNVLEPYYRERDFLFAIKLLITLLRKEVLIAEGSLVTAAQTAPMHGLLQCIRHLLTCFDPQNSVNFEAWNTVIQTIVKYAFQIYELVSPAVSSLAPEGYVLEELDDHNILVDQIIQKCNFDDNSMSEIDRQSQISQMLLVCCWRTMKEVCLLLGDLCHTSLSYEKICEREKQPILTFECVETIGELFLNILSSSRHVGAFELAYSGFAKICDALWRSTDSKTRFLTSKWIDSVVADLITDRPSPVLCMTRRSAGLPYYIQAICITEPPISKFATMKKVMTALLKFCENVEMVKGPGENQKVICLNIMRALFRETKHGEEVFMFVPDGFRIAIHGLKSGSWAVRNSCTLLYSALMGRVFGTKKTRKTGREFFSRFPDMFPILLKEMESIEKAAVKEAAKVRLYPTTYPVLLLLSHLYASTIDGRDSRLSLANFIPYVIRCGVSPIHKTRCMAARALTSLVTPDILENTMIKILVDIEEMAQNGKIKQNSLHGKLLQVKHLINGDQYASRTKLMRWHLLERACSKLGHMSWILSSENSCCLTKSVFLEITAEYFLLMKKTGNCTLGLSIPQHFNTLLTEELIRVLCQPAAVSCNLGWDELCVLCSKILIENAMDGSNSGVRLDWLRLQSNGLCLCIQDTVKRIHVNRIALFQIMLTNEHTPVRQTALQYLIDNPRKGDAESILTLLLTRFIEDTEEDRRCRIKIIELMSSKTNIFNEGTDFDKQISISIKMWEKINQTIVRFGESDALVVCCLKLAARLLLSVAKRFDGRRGSNVGIKCEMFKEIAQFISMSVNPEKSRQRREAVSILYKEDLLRFIVRKPYAFTDDVLLLLWLNVFDLLQDEDESVRDNLAYAVSHLFKTSDLLASSVSPFVCPASRSDAYYVHSNVATQIILNRLRSLLAEGNSRFWLCLIIGILFRDNTFTCEDLESEKQTEENGLRDTVVFREDRRLAQTEMVLFESGEVNSFAESFLFRWNALSGFKVAFKAITDEQILTEIREYYCQFLRKFRINDLVAIAILQWGKAEKTSYIVKRVRDLFNLLLFFQLYKVILGSAPTEVSRVEMSKIDSLCQHLKNHLKQVGIFMCSLPFDMTTSLN